MKHLKLYYVDSEYLDRLRKIDNRVSQKGNRPFIGILLSINNCNYLAPLTSPYKNNSNKVLERKRLIENEYTILLENDEDFYGAIRLNNMIPISNETVIHELTDEYMFTIGKNKKYIELIHIQNQIIQNKEQYIKQKAQDVYYKYSDNKICNDFIKLEKQLNIDCNEDLEDEEDYEI